MFNELDAVQYVPEEEVEETIGLNMPIDNDYFREHTEFFTSIGYIANQVAYIENNLRNSMVSITSDPEVVFTQTQEVNLGRLLSLYELVFLAKFGEDSTLKEWFYAVKTLLLKANKYRNEAVHTDWMFIGKGPDKPCYFEDKKGTHRYVIVSPALMRKRAIFVHTVFEYFDDLRAVTEDPEYWDVEGIEEAKVNLAKLTQGFLKPPRIYKKKAI